MIDIARIWYEMAPAAFHAAIKKLSYREREILKLRTGAGDGYTYTLAEAGRIFKVTPERIRSIERKACEKMTVLMREAVNQI